MSHARHMRIARTSHTRCVLRDPVTEKTKATAKCPLKANWRRIQSTKSTDFIKLVEEPLKMSSDPISEQSFSPLEADFKSPDRERLQRLPAAVTPPPPYPGQEAAPMGASRVKQNGVRPTEPSLAQQGAPNGSHQGALNGGHQSIHNGAHQPQYSEPSNTVGQSVVQRQNSIKKSMQARPISHYSNLNFCTNSNFYPTSVLTSGMCSPWKNCNCGL
jgi:hypothetical protein